MNKRQFGVVFVLLLLLNACSPSTDAIATPTVEVETSTPVPATSTLTATDIPPATFTPFPTQISTPTPTVPPSPSTLIPMPAPDIRFSADRSYIKVGMCVVFSWDVENSQANYFYAEGEPWKDSMVSPHGSREACRKESTTYYLRVVGFYNAVEIREIHIPVEPMPGL